MRYFLVYGAMFNKIVTAKDESEVKGKILKEMTLEEVKEYMKNYESGIESYAR